MGNILEAGIKKFILARRSILKQSNNMTVRTKTNVSILNEQNLRNIVTLEELNYIIHERDIRPLSSLLCINSRVALLQE